MQMRGSTNKSPINSVLQKINYISDLFTNGENRHDKNPNGNFKVTTPRIHYYQNKRLQVQ